MAPRTMLAAMLLLASHPAWAQRGTGGSSDPTVQPAGDPHGAITSMSKASEPQHKSDHAVTTVPNLVPSTSGSPSDEKR